MVATEMTLSLQPHPNNARARQRVLSGQDDGHDFQVVVPIRIKSVEDAIEWLRPDGVPSDAPRQGEFFFVPASAGWKPSSLAEDTSTDAGSWRRVEVTDGPRAFGDHEVTRGGLAPGLAISRVTRSQGATCFIGRKAVKSHSWTGRPRYFVRGAIVHPEHGVLDLGTTWHEVVPNKAHGPWPVTGGGRYSD